MLEQESQHHCAVCAFLRRACGVTSGVTLVYSLRGAEQEGPAHNPWSTHGPHPVAVRLY